MGKSKNKSATTKGGDSPFPHSQFSSVLTGDLVPWPWRIFGDDLFPWPWRPTLTTSASGGRDGGAYTAAPPGHREQPGVADYHALRLADSILISARGTVPNVNQIADIRQLPIRVTPAEFGLFFYTPQIVLPALRPFAFTEQFPFPSDAKTVTIHDANGEHSIAVQSHPLFTKAVSASGSASPSVRVGVGGSLQEAFDRACMQLSRTPRRPDDYVSFTVIETGRYRGGFAGVDHHYAVVELREGKPPA